jgi:diaminopimelate decarboxylase
VDTPAYVYSIATFRDHYRRFHEAFASLQPIICYSIKTCGNINLLRELVALGSGMDVVSGGELFRAQIAGADMSKVVYAGVGKTDMEISDALRAKIGWFNIESEAEFENISAIANQIRQNGRAALRINPDVADSRTHPKTKTGNKGSKFGVDIERAKRFFETYGRNKNLSLSAVHLHLGSPIYSPEPYVDAIKKTLILIEELKQKGFNITMLDVGGGFPADYETGSSPSYKDFAAMIVPLLQPFANAGGQIIFEPGRTISANSGVLITRVLYVKNGGDKKFVVVDTGMHHLIRPTLYESFHFIWPTQVSPEFIPSERKINMNLSGLEYCDVVGPICESSDYLAKGRHLPPVRRGDILCIFSAGAYGMVMASQYNAIPRPPEVLVDGNKYEIIRLRETYKDLIAHEIMD